MQEAAQYVQQHKARGSTRGGLLRGAGRSLWTGMGLALLLALASVPASRSQNSGSNGGTNGNGGQSISRPPYGTRQGGIGPSSDEEFDPVMAERRIRALNTERQKL